MAISRDSAVSQSQAGTEKLKAHVQMGDDGQTQQRAEHAAAAAGDQGASHHHAGNDLQLGADVGVRDGRVVPHGSQNGHRGGHQTVDSIQNPFDFVDGNGGKARGLAVVSHGEAPAPEAAVMHQQDHSHQHQACQPELAGDSQQPSHVQKGLRKTGDAVAAGDGDGQPPIESHGSQGSHQGREAGNHQQAVQTPGHRPGQQGAAGRGFDGPAPVLPQHGLNHAGEGYHGAHREIDAAGQDDGGHDEGQDPHLDPRNPDIHQQSRPPDLGEDQQQGQGQQNPGKQAEHPAIGAPARRGGVRPRAHPLKPAHRFHPRQARSSSSAARIRLPTTRSVC